MIKSQVFGLCFFIIVLYKKYYLIFDKKVFKNFYNLNILNEKIFDFSQIKFLFKTYRKNYNFWFLKKYFIKKLWKIQELNYYFIKKI